MKRQRVVRNNLMKLLETYPDLKESYNGLAVQYWRQYDDVTCLDDIAFATPAESITREFRKMVSSGIIEVPERTKQRRKELEIEFRKSIRN